MENIGKICTSLYYAKAGANTSQSAFLKKGGKMGKSQEAIKSGIDSFNKNISKPRVFGGNIKLIRINSARDNNKHSA